MKIAYPTFRRWLRWVWIGLFLAVGASAQTLVLDNFNVVGGSGSVLPPQFGPSWSGSVTQNTSTITVGGTAMDINGWGVSGQQINATGMNYLVVVAQRDAGHQAGSLVVLFEDLQLETQIISISASQFVVGALTQVVVPLPTWPAGFDLTKITGWSVGGGTGGGLSAFRMTFDNLALSSASSFTLHSADTDRNSRISLVELTRVIEIYNTRKASIRTGAYLVQTGTEDGFGPDPTRDTSGTVTLTLYHSADPNHDGRLDLTELTRVIELYNYRSGTIRTGNYRALAGTEDGFAAGP